jgi:PAS domain S-box-containing protein
MELGIGGAAMNPSRLEPNESVTHRSSWPLRPVHLRGYLVAILSVGAALGASLLVEHFHFRVPAVALLLLAVAVSSWYGGTGPAVLALVLSISSFYYYFVEPVRTPYIYPSEIPFFITFVGFAALMSWFSIIRRRAEKNLRHQAELLNLTHDTVFVMDMDGVIKYWNRGAEERYGWTAEQAVGRVVHDLLKTVFPAPLDEIKAEVTRAGRWEGELLHTKKDGTQLVVASRWALQRDKRGAPVIILETNNDITERKRAEEALRRSNRELRALSDCNQTLLRATDEQSLLDEICRIVCQEAGYRMAWAAYAEHDEARSVRPVAWTGTEEGYLANLGITWADTERGRGPTGTAIRSGKTCYIEDFTTDPRLASWRDSDMLLDFRSGIALPLKDEHADVFGSLTVYSAQPNAFASEEIGLLEELAADLAFGIVTLRSRAARKQAEREVALLGFALGNVREAAMLVDDTARFHYVNEEACRVLGYSREELLGMAVRDIDPEFPAGRWSDHWSDLKAQRSLSFESRHQSRDGRIFPVEISANYFEYGGRAYNIALVRDITERKRAEDKIQQQDLERRQILDFAPQLVAVFGQDRKRLYANRPALDYFGVTLEEWLSISDRFWFFHPDDRERVAKDVYAGHSSDVPHEFEARLRRMDGVYRWFLFRDNPLRDDQGLIARWYLSATDIEDRKRAEHERQAQVWFLESMDRINRAMQGTNDLEQGAGDVIEAMLAIFDSERAFLYYPCDPNAPSFEVVMARTRPEYAVERGVIPMTPDTARGFQTVLASSGVVTFGPGCDHPLVGDFAKRFGHKSSIGIALYPKTGKPWVLVLHQCSYARVWTPDERKLVEEIARRLADSLTGLLMFRSRRESEETLRQSEAYLAETQRLSHTGSWALNADTREYTYWSEEMFRIFGVDPREGVPPREAMGRRIHPEDRNRAHSGFERSLKEKVDTSDEYRFVLPDGTVKHIHAIRHPVVNAAGVVVELMGSFMDITERKRAEEALRRSEAYLAESQRLAHTGTFVSDETTKPLYWSEELYRIYGFDPQQGLPTRDQPPRRIHPEDLDKFWRAWQRGIRDKVDTDVEYRIVLPDGTVKHVYGMGHPVLNADGELIELVGTTVDITERKLAEEALRESETRFRTFVDHAGDALFVQDFEQGTIVDVNRQACENLGYTRQELIGNTAVAFHLDSDRVEMESPAKRAAAGETVIDRHSHRRKDGSTFPVEVHTSLFSYGGRRFLLSVARDISDRVRAEEQREMLRQLEADLAHINRVSMMGELAASIAHEVNQPLAGVVSNGSACLRWLAGDAPNLEEARETARRIVRDGKRAAEVINRIRALTKRTAALREELNLNETVREVVALIGDEAKRKSVIIRTQFADDLSPVSGDRVQLQQVALNLVMNAIEAMSGVGERPRELMITTRNIDPDEVQVTVEDSGIGIDPRMIDKIFDSFYTTKAGGMGMGLSISRSILQAHGGRLWATLKTGPGTVFHFALPKHHGEEANAAVPGV